MCHPLDLHPVSALAADVHVFARSAHSRSHLACTAVKEPDIFGRLGQLIRSEAVRTGHDLYQRHAQAVSLEYPFVAYV